MVSTLQVATTFNLYISEPLNGLSAYDTEVRGILFASVSEPAARYALAAMGILRASYTKHDDIFTIKCQESHAFRCSIDNYNRALAVLADRLSTGTRAAAEVALHCCQIFISIEALQADYTAAIRHFIQGLRVMREYHVRSYIDTSGTLMAADNPLLPRIDTFALKLFLAPCPGFRRPCGGTRLVQNEESATAKFRHGRAQIKAIAYSTLEFLESTPRLPKETLFTAKQELLRRLEEWRCSMHFCLERPLQVDEAAMFLCHQMMVVILANTLSSSPEDLDRLELEMDETRSVAEWLTMIRARGWSRS